MFRRKAPGQAAKRSERRIPRDAVARNILFVPLHPYFYYVYIGSTQFPVFLFFLSSCLAVFLNSDPIGGEYGEARRWRAGGMGLKMLQFTG